jgi:hypothetical protein
MYLTDLNTCICQLVSKKLFVWSELASAGGDVLRKQSQIQSVPFKTQPYNNHVLRYKNEIRSRSIPV